MDVRCDLSGFSSEARTGPILQSSHHAAAFGYPGTADTGVIEIDDPITSGTKADGYLLGALPLEGPIDAGDV